MAACSRAPATAAAAVRRRQHRPVGSRLAPSLASCLQPHSRSVWACGAPAPAAGPAVPRHPAGGAAVRPAQVPGQRVAQCRHRRRCVTEPFLSALWLPIGPALAASPGSPAARRKGTHRCEPLPAGVLLLLYKLLTFHRWRDELPYAPRCGRSCLLVFYCPLPPLQLPCAPGGVDSGRRSLARARLRLPALPRPAAPPVTRRRAVPWLPAGLAWRCSPCCRSSSWRTLPRGPPRPATCASTTTSRCRRVDRGRRGPVCGHERLRLG